MPTTLLQAPPVIAFSKNRIQVKIKSDNFRTGLPVKAVSKLTINAAFAADQQIALSWKYGSATFKAAVSPDDSGLQIPTGNGGNAHAAAMLAIIKYNYFVNRDFEVTLDTSGAHPFFLFAAKYDGVGYILNTASDPRYDVANPTPGADGALLNGFMHYLQVLISDSAGGAWKPSIYNYNVPLDDYTTGVTTIDLSDLLHSYLKLDFPDLTSTWKVCTRSTLRFKLVYAPFYGSPAFVRAVTESAIYNVVWGGYSHLAIQQIGDRPQYLQQYLLPAPALYKSQRWLESWPVDRREVKTNQPQFLYFVNNRTVTETFKIKLELTMSDGSAQVVYLAGGSLLSYQKVCVGCGYKQLGLRNYTTDIARVSSYKISLVEAVTLESRSQAKTFMVNRDYEEFTRYFVYSDSAGNFKTLRTFGTSQLSAEIKADQVGLETDPLRTARYGSYQNSNILATHNDKVNTGYISSAAFHDSLMELCMAKRVFRVAGNAMIPIVITSKNFDYSADGKLLNASLFEYRLAYDDDLYTGDSSALHVPQLNQSQQPLNDI